MGTQKRSARTAGRALDGEAVAERIRQVMSRLELTQTALADHLALTQPTISQYLGGRIPPPEVLVRLARLGGTTVDWLLTGEGELQRVSEPWVPYGRQARLLEAFDRLPEELQESLVQLCRKLVRYVEGPSNQ